MDMKKILQALDNATSKPVEGSNDIKRSLEIINEGANPHKVSLPVQMAMQHYQEPASEPLPVKESILKKYVAEAEEEIQAQKDLEQQRIWMYSRKIANRVLVKEAAQNEQDFRVIQQTTKQDIAALTKELEKVRYVHAKAKEITREIKYDDVPSSIITRLRELARSINMDQTHLESAEEEVFEAIRNLESTIYNLDDVFNEFASEIEYQIDELQGQLDDMQWEKKYGRPLNEGIDLNPEDTVSMDIPLLIRLLEYAREDAKTDMDLHNVAEMLINLSKDGNTLSMAQYDQIVGNQKLLPEPTNEACWKNYKQIGMKKKNGKTVPNCVPKKK